MVSKADHRADQGGFNDKRGGYPSGSKPVSQLPKIPPRDRKPRETPPSNNR